MSSYNPNLNLRSFVSPHLLPDSYLSLGSEVLKLPEGLRSAVAEEVRVASDLAAKAAGERPGFFRRIVRRFGSSKKTDTATHDVRAFMDTVSDTDCLLVPAGEVSGDVRFLNRHLEALASKALVVGDAERQPVSRDFLHVVTRGVTGVPYGKEGMRGGTFAFTGNDSLSGKKATSDRFLTGSSYELSLLAELGSPTHHAVHTAVVEGGGRLADAAIQHLVDIIRQHKKSERPVVLVADHAKGGSGHLVLAAAVADGLVSRMARDYSGPEPFSEVATCYASHIAVAAMRQVMLESRTVPQSFRLEELEVAVKASIAAVALEQQQSQAQQIPKAEGKPLLKQRHRTTVQQEHAQAQQIPKAEEKPLLKQRHRTTVQQEHERRTVLSGDISEVRQQVNSAISQGDVVQFDDRFGALMGLHDSVEWQTSMLENVRRAVVRSGDDGIIHAFNVQREALLRARGEVVDVQEVADPYAGLPYTDVDEAFANGDFTDAELERPLGGARRESYVTALKHFSGLSDSDFGSSVDGTESPVSDRSVSPAADEGYGDNLTKPAVVSPVSTVPDISAERVARRAQVMDDYGDMVASSLSDSKEGKPRIAVLQPEAAEALRTVVHSSRPATIVDEAVLKRLEAAADRSSSTRV